MNPELLKLISRPEVQEKWKPQRYDMVIEDGKPSTWGHLIDSSMGYITHPRKQVLWLPLPIDPLDYILNLPKEKRRGVWEWIDWGMCSRRILDDGTLRVSVPLTEVNDGIAEDDPLTTLLKVFLWQKGIET